MPALDRRTLLCALAAVPLSPGAAEALPAFSSRRIAVSSVGAGRDVILIPGLASGPSVWRDLLRAMSGARIRWHLVTVRGFAGLAADLNAQGPLMKPVADEIARYIITQRLDAPAIIGHSMGGTLALMLGLRGRPPLSRLMVVDMLPDGAGMLGGTSEGFGYLAKELNGYFTGTKAGRQLLADMVRQTPAGRDCDPRVISRALADMAQTDLRSQLPRLPCPLEVVIGAPADRDLRAARIARFREAYRAVPGVRLSPVGPAGHMVQQEQPAAFASRVRAFLERG